MRRILACIVCIFVIVSFMNISFWASDENIRVIRITNANFVPGDNLLKANDVGGSNEKGAYAWYLYTDLYVNTENLPPFQEGDYGWDTIPIQFMQMYYINPIKMSFSVSDTVDLSDIRSVTFRYGTYEGDSAVEIDGKPATFAQLWAGTEVWLTLNGVKVASVVYTEENWDRAENFTPEKRLAFDVSDVEGTGSLGIELIKPYGAPEMLLHSFEAEYYQSPPLTGDISRHAGGTVMIICAATWCLYIMWRRRVNTRNAG